MTLYPYRHLEIQDCAEPLVNLADYNFVLEPAYYQAGWATTPQMYLRQGVANRLATVQAQLAPLRFKIWDGWRPRAVQQAIYNHYWRELTQQHPDWKPDRLQQAVGMFVTPATQPDLIPPHASGGAVDLTLVDEHGRELPMGTGFDHFGPEAAAHYYEPAGQNATLRANRRNLRLALQAAGFRADADEWWHFDYGNQLWAAALGQPFAIYGEIALT